jgi:citrate lyase subunit beta/citryl-CoA lyase
VPKVNSADEVRAIEAVLPDGVEIWAMIETPLAVLRCAEIAGASDRLTALVLGTNDLAKELLAEQVPGRAPLLGALSMCVLAARATGTAILDGVYNDVRDAAGFAAECRQGKEFGFDGKTLIHPGQVEPCNRIFAPSEEDIAGAERIIEAFEAARREGRGVVTVDGRMIENLHVDNARRTLALATAITDLT